MSYGEIKRKTTEVQERPAVSNACPAYGCPNAASVSLDGGGRWSCYAHATRPFEVWHEVTTKIRDEWPASCNWSHPEKVRYEEQAATRRRAARAA
jgi:hypothetical protein